MEDRIIPVLIGSTQVGTATIFNDETAIGVTVSLDVELIGYTLDVNADGEIIAMLLGWPEEDERRSYYVVEHDFLYGWDDAGWQEDGKPQRFPTREIAQRAIEEHCRELDFDVNDYRVKEVFVDG